MTKNPTAKSADSLRRVAPYLSRAGTVEVAERLFHVKCAPNSVDFRSMQDAIDFVAASWWRRTLTRWVSGGRVRFERGSDEVS